jgi:hypothetical protein
MTRSLTVPVYDATLGTMCFAAALLSMRMGGRVRRESWRDGWWVGIEHIGRYPSFYLRTSYTRIERWGCNQTDVLAEDWMEAVVPHDAQA